MPIDDKLAYEIYSIVLYHSSALLALFSFSFYIYLRAKKTPLLYSYLGVVGTICLWMLAKIFKTVSPTVELRWFFIVLQYLGAHFLGFCLIVFAYIYTKDKTPPRKTAALWLLLPAVSFIITLTNPLHMGFYAYFDFYKDRFGTLFYWTQAVQYVYWLIGILMLSRGFTSQRGFMGNRKMARLFAVVTLLPVLVNVYYIFFKMGVLRWVFPFPVFDFTPIAAAVALILFTLPALNDRFFDISPITYGKVFEELPKGLVFMDRTGWLYGGNSAFYALFKLPVRRLRVDDFANGIRFTDASQRAEFLSFIGGSGPVGPLELVIENDRTIRVLRKVLKNKAQYLDFTDMTATVRNRRALAEQNAELVVIKEKLDTLAENTRALAVARTKAQAAQNMHDILGHSLTVVIGTAELAAAETDRDAAVYRLSQVSQMLISSLNDLKNTLKGKAFDLGQTSLIKALAHLKNDSIALDLSYQGAVYELRSAQTEAVFRLCQEAVTNAIKHGKAKTIHLILRYKPEAFEVFAIDDGLGCADIVKSYGLMGIEARITALSGRVEFGSDGEKGFVIHAVLPGTI